MRLIVHVKPGSRSNQVIQTAEDTYVVLTTAIPEHDKANQATLRLLAKHLSLPMSRLRLVLGRTAREKLIEILPN